MSNWTIRSKREHGDPCEVCGAKVVTILRGNYCRVVVLSVAATLGIVVSTVLGVIMGATL